MHAHLPENAGEPIVTSRRQRDVYIRLRNSILDRSLTPGTKLPEDELAEIYSVSRTIIRAALQSLARDRLVTLRPNRGAAVAMPNSREAREVFEARALVEPHVATLAATLATADEVEGLRQHLVEEHTLMHSGDDGEAVMQSARFHVGIAAISKQIILLEFVRDLCSRSSLIISLYQRRRSAICDVDAHVALVDAIEARNTKLSARLMTEHLDHLIASLDFERRTDGKSNLAELLAR
jgi:DNA-binding GntR family transcriptional regulator